MSRRMRKLTPDASTKHRFGAELRLWRVQRGMSQAELGAGIMYSASTVAKVEKAERWPSRDFALQSDSVLRCNGSLLQLWEDAQRDQKRSRDRASLPVTDDLVTDYPQLAHAAGLLAGLVELWKDLSTIVALPASRYQIMASIDMAVAHELAITRPESRPRSGRR